MILWVIIYNVFIYPIFFLVGGIGSIFSSKLKKGFIGRFKTITKIEQYINNVENGRPVYWFHVASHGEFEQTRPIISGLKEVEPDSIILVSFFSPSGYNNVDDKCIDCKIYLPFDFIWSVRRALKIVKPKKIMFAAYDIWPNFIWLAYYRKIPTTIFAAHFTKKTLKLAPVFRSFYRSVYHYFKAIYTISASDYLSLQKIVKLDKSPIIRALGNPRYDQVKKKADQFTQKRTISVLLREKRIVAGSVWPQDMEIIAEPIVKLMKEDEDLKLIWVPHEVGNSFVKTSLDYFNSQGFSTHRLISKRAALNDSRVIVVDVIGVLSRLYWEGQIAYIGGAFTSGVHNVMEPAIARLPVLFGPRYQNSHEAKELISAGGGTSISNSKEVYQILSQYLKDKNMFLNGSFAATEVIHRNLGSSTRIVRSLIRD